MTDQNELSFDEFDELQNPREEVTDFETITDQALKRRSFFKGGLALGLSSLVMGAGVGSFMPRAMASSDLLLILSRPVRKIQLRYQQALNGKLSFAGGILFGQMGKSSIIRQGGQGPVRNCPLAIIMMVCRYFSIMANIYLLLTMNIPTGKSSMQVARANLRTLMIFEREKLRMVSPWLRSWNGMVNGKLLRIVHTIVE